MREFAEAAEHLATVLNGQQPSWATATQEEILNDIKQAFDAHKRPSPAFPTAERPLVVERDVLAQIKNSTDPELATARQAAQDGRIIAPRIPRSRGWALTAEEEQAFDQMTDSLTALVKAMEGQGMLDDVEREVKRKMNANGPQRDPFAKRGRGR